MQKQPIQQTSSLAINTLSKYIKQQKTYQVEYKIILQMLNILNKKQKKQLDTKIISTMSQLYSNLSPMVKQTQLYQHLNYLIWNIEQFPVQIREKTKLFIIVSQWILQFQLHVNNLKDFKSQIAFLKDFFMQHTHNLYQKITLIQEISQDLAQLLGQRFWNKQQYNSSPNKNTANKNQLKPATKTQAKQLIGYISTMIEYYQVFTSQQSTRPMYSTQMYLLKHNCTHYLQFILKSLQFILSVNSNNENNGDKSTAASRSMSLTDKFVSPSKVNKKYSYPFSPPKPKPSSQTKNNKKQSQTPYLQPHDQMQLTRLALIFLQNKNINDKQCLKIIKLLMLRTNKIVRLAMVIDYVQFYEYLQKQNKQQILQQLENMIYFRQLIIGHSQISNNLNTNGLKTNQFRKKQTTIQLAARSKTRLLFTHQANKYGEYSVLHIQIRMEVGTDINIIIYHITVDSTSDSNNKQKQYWRETKTGDRCVDIVLKQNGLYFLEFDNSYSWIRMQQFCSGIISQNQGYQIQKYTQKQNKVESKQQKQQALDLQLNSKIDQRQQQLQT